MSKLLYLKESHIRCNQRRHVVGVALFRRNIRNHLLATLDHC